MRGRPAKVTQQEVIRALKEHGTVTAAAVALNVHRSTLQSHLRTARKSGVIPPPKKGCVQRWVSDHPDAQLPRSVKGIMDLTDCSRDAVNHFLRTRKGKVMRIAKAVGDLKRAPDFRIGDRLYQPRRWDTYSVSADPYALSLRIQAHPEGEDAPVFFYLPVRMLVKLMEGVKSDVT